GAVATLSKSSPMASWSALCHQFAMMIIPVLPFAKASKYGPVVFASAALRSVSVAPDSISSSYSSATACVFGSVSADWPESSSRYPLLEAANDKNGWTTPESQLVITPNPWTPSLSSAKVMAYSLSSSQVSGGPSM